VAQRMHAVEDIKTKSKLAASVNMAPITWPAFVASCEAINRDPWTSWWRRVQCYKIANIKLQWKVVQLVWRKRDELDEVNSSQFDWGKAVHSMDLSLLPI
jgi:arginine metabolism regulation protein II